MLDTAQIGKEENGEWIVSRDGVALHTLHGSYTPAQIVGIMEFAQKFERLAHHDGAEMGRESMRAVASQRVLEMQSRIDALTQHNTFLAEKLDDLISKGV